MERAIIRSLFRYIPMFALAIAGSTAIVAEAAPRPVTVLASASGEGELTMCGCKNKPLGGLARRATLIESARERNAATVLVDAGNFAAAGGFEPLEKTRKIWDIMARLGYDAVTPGDRELSHGLAGVRSLEAAHPEVRIISANITDAAGALLWPESVVIERDGVRIGVTGVTSGNVYREAVARGEAPDGDFMFADADAALRRAVDRLRGDVDVVVALIQDGPAGVQRLAGEIPGIDVAVTGYKPGYQFQPQRVGETLILRGGQGGKYLPMLDLMLDGEAGVVDYSGEAKPVNQAVAPEPELNAEIDAWVEAFRSREKGGEL